MRLPVRGGRFALAFALGLLVLLGASRFLSNRIDPERVARVEVSREVVWAVAQHGLSELGRPEQQLVYDVPGAAGSLPVLLAAWSRSSLGRLGWLDPLTSVRLPWLVGAALALALLALLTRRARSLGAPWIALAVTCVAPGWALGATRASDAWIVAASWLAALCAYKASLHAPGDGPGRLCASFLAALAIGAGSALHLAALWVLPVFVAHSWLATGECPLRPESRGVTVVPAAVPLGIAAASFAIPAFDPSTWNKSSTELVHFAADALGGALAAPGGVSRLVSRPVFTTALLVLFGLAPLLLRRGFGAGVQRGWQELRSDTLLAVMSVGVALLAAPAAGAELVLPFAAWLGSIGLGALFASSARRALAPLALGALGIALAVDWLGALSQLGAAVTVGDR